MEKIEPRGKYAGVKIHLNGEECQRLLDWRKRWKAAAKLKTDSTIKALADAQEAIEFTKEVAKAIEKLLIERPDLLQDRTEEQVAAALQKDKDKIEAQQAAMKSKKDWKKVK